MTTRTSRLVLVCMVAAGSLVTEPAEPPVRPAAEAQGRVVFQAMEQELDRALQLQMEDLESPYFVQFSVTDRHGIGIGASYGALTGSNSGRSRMLSTQVRIGTPELDNTNFSGSGFSFSPFTYMQHPVEDDLLALRRALWLAVDADYKSSVETLTKKRAYLQDKTIEDRPADFSAADATVHQDPVPVLECDQAAWEQRVRDISARLRAHPHIQDGSVSFSAGTVQRYLANTEGTRLRMADGHATLSIGVKAQAEDGMRFSDQLTYQQPDPARLPSVEQVTADIDAMAGRLQQAMQAGKLESYLGPVLFDSVAAPQVIRAMLSDGVAGQPDPVGRPRGGASSDFEKKIGQRILPRSFRVWDDPTVEDVDGETLAGHYRFDDEGVPARRVEIVEGGKLLGMVMGRSPTRKFTQSTGHGRGGGFFGAPSASIGNLFVESEDALTAEELKEELIQAALDEGLEFGVRIAALQSRGGGSFNFGGGVRMPDPLYAWKVYVEDGREEPFRGCKFGNTDVRALRDILFAGSEPQVDNSRSGLNSSSVVSPALLFEELELVKIEQELDSLPVLEDPLFR